MSNKIKAGVIGIGAIGKNHARIYSEIDSADLVAVFDTDTDAAKEIVNLYGGILAGSIEEFLLWSMLSRSQRPRILTD